MKNEEEKHRREMSDMYECTECLMQKVCLKLLSRTGQVFCSRVGVKKQFNAIEEEHNDKTGNF